MSSYIAGLLMGSLIGFLTAYWLIFAYLNNWIGNRR